MDYPYEIWEEWGLEDLSVNGSGDLAQLVRHNRLANGLMVPFNESTRRPDGVYVQKNFLDINA